MLGRPETPPLAGVIPRPADGMEGAGARLGSPPPTAGVDEFRPGAVDDVAELSALESGLVGFLR